MGNTNDLGNPQRSAVLAPEADTPHSAFQNKIGFEVLAQKELPYKLGRRYADIVLFCLRCLDSGDTSSSLGPGAVDADGVTIGVSYIENVLEKIESIQI